ncbi:phage terminase small subunit [Heyndrickxia ginsengihumi]|uniref:phage terminase small subunit n=1 Tax=Heyndrickxia ginsengihumi TaxID=363870 RepID=UPI0004723055|nr:phage terminase small subunit [Heyndrickxia ginsengihumi]
MPRPRDPRRDQAFELWKNSGGSKKLKEIAKELGVSDSQVRKWKNQDKWEDQIKGNVTNQTNGNVTKRGAPKGNKNARGNKGGKAPPGNQNAKGNKGGAAPKGNKNAVTTGEYETIMWDFLDEDEKELFESIETDPLYQIDITIRELSIRQRRMMKRIKRIEDGLTERQRRVLQELKDMKDIHVVEKNGVQVKVPVKTSALVVTQIEETEFKKIDDILSLEEALTRVTDKLLKAIKQKSDMESGIDEKALKLEKMRVEIEKTKIETEKLKNKDGSAETEKEVAAALRGLVDAINSEAD